MGPKAPKKSKEEIAAEKAAAEAEAARLAEIERKKAEALAEKQRIEAEKLQAERVASRKAEIERLGAEYETFSEELKKRQAAKAIFDDEEFARKDWEKFRAPTDAPDAGCEKDMNTFITLTRNNEVCEMSEVLNVVREVELVANTVHDVWSQSLADRDYNNLQITNSYMEQFASCIVDKLDAATAQFLRFVDNNLNDRSEVQVEECTNDDTNGASLGLWGSFSDIRPIRKSIQFESMGIQMDVPKQILQQGIFVHRAIRIPIDHASVSVYNDPQGAGASKQVLGDLIKLDILVPPPQAFEIRAKKWVLREKSNVATALKSVAYPSTIGMRCYVKVPDFVIMSPDVRVMCWDDNAREWTEDGITDYQYSESGRLCQFMLTTCGTVALVKSRTIDFPYKRWTLAPRRSIPSAKGFFEKEACFTLHTARFEIVIEIRGNQCCLANEFDPAVADLAGQNMGPGALLYKLQARGVNVLPHESDMPKVENNGDAKKLELEDDVLSEIARCASSFDFSSSSWNKEVGNQRVGLLARESTVYTARSETYDYECILVEEDAVTESRCYAPEAGSVAGTGSSNCVFKCVLGNQYGTRPGFSHAARPGETSHLELISSLKGRCTPEAIERAGRVNELFADTVLKLLRMVRPLSLTFEEPSKK
eukprot:GSChrysophyteH1.ASY1.ANO1.600.1 assembled CDS